MSAAANSRRAIRARTVLRSVGLIPRSLPESNGMLNWRGAANGSAGVDRRLISLLLDDGRFVQAASSETALDQQVMQLDQARYRHPRRPEPHPSAGGWIQHPCRHHDDHAGRHLDVNDITAGPPLGILAPHTAPIECVPAVTNFDFLPDMGRMTARLLSGAGIGCSPVPMPAGRLSPTR